MSKLERNRPSILFVTYRELISKGNNATDTSRYDQLLDWLCEDNLTKDYFDGVLIFDEAHKAKNFRDDSEVQSTMTGKKVVSLQRDLPRARVVCNIFIF